jgi:hypothetical protein
VKAGPTIVDVVADPYLFGEFFAPPEDWATWMVFLKALFALPMSDAEAARYRHHTGRVQPPTHAAREAWLVVGRRGGKSRIAALIAVFLACFRSYNEVLRTPGQRGVVMVLAADRKQAAVVVGYVVGLLEAHVAQADCAPDG